MVLHCELSGCEQNPGTVLTALALDSNDAERFIVKAATSWRGGMSGKGIMRSCFDDDRDHDDDDDDDDDHHHHDSDDDDDDDDDEMMMTLMMTLI